ncbi:PEP-CTERM sorting domain-containing protein [Niveibacterium terrae]|uniref:PEP-CTERM sorting domain-containing protein n=1 Tax=Niveibacterium terrae TaxID=3373598 RepID=UPI003A910A81
MNTRIPQILFAGLVLCSAMSHPAVAGVITGGTVIDATESSCCGLTADKLVDQSGLSTGYTSGVTNFDTYSALGVTALGSSTTPEFPGGYYATVGAHVDIDLGQSLTVTKLALWNDQDFQGVDAFHLLISSDPSFATSTSLGSFNALYGNNDNEALDYSVGVPIQVFDLNDASGRYVRVVFDSAHLGPYVNLNEIAFDVGATSVPEPASIALLGLGLAGIGISRRTSKKR